MYIFVGIYADILFEKTREKHNNNIIAFVYRGIHARFNGKGFQYDIVFIVNNCRLLLHQSRSAEGELQQKIPAGVCGCSVEFGSSFFIPVCHIRKSQHRVSIRSFPLFWADST
jgi:hypothetical protein